MFDPMKHEAMLRQESDEIDTDHIVMVMQAGYMRVTRSSGPQRSPSPS